MDGMKNALKMAISILAISLALLLYTSNGDAMIGNSSGRVMLCTVLWYTALRDMMDIMR